MQLGGDNTNNIDYDDFELSRVGDSIKNQNLSEDELKSLRAHAGANPETGFYESTAGSLSDEIHNYARNLNLTDGVHFDYRKMAEKVGIENFDPRSVKDMEELEKRLKDVFDHKIAEETQNEIEKNNEKEYLKNSSRRDLRNDSKNLEKQAKNAAKTEDRKNRLGNLGNNIGNKISSLGDKLKDSDSEFGKKIGNKLSESGSKLSDKSAGFADNARREANAYRNDIKRQQEYRKNSKSLKGRLGKKLAPPKLHEKNGLEKNDDSPSNESGKSFGIKAIKKIGGGLKNFISAGNDVLNGNIASALLKIGKIFLAIFSPVLIIICFLAIIVLTLLSPLLEVFQAFDNATTTAANFTEKLNNFYSGFGFQNSKDAFYDELKDLQNKYDNQLDVDLLMTTIFYSEMVEGYENTKYADVESEGIIDQTVTMSGMSEKNDSKTMFDILGTFLKQKVKEKVEESYATMGEDGLSYTVGKVYRLRKLARNEFETGKLGVPLRTNGVLKTAKLSEFFSFLSEDLKDLFCAIVSMALGLDHDITTYIVHNVIGSRYSEETLFNIRDKIENLGLSLMDVVGDLIVGLSSIEDISIPNIIDEIKNFLNSLDFSNLISTNTLDKVRELFSNIFNIQITYRTFAKSDENYKEYLKQYYIPNMPEFWKYVYNEDMSINEKEVDKIVQEIYDLRDQYNALYGESQVIVTENYDNVCVGAVNKNLVSLMALPVDIDSSNCINFSSGYGYGITSSGIDHKGIDFNSITTHNNQGDNVYSIASGGKVLESSADNTYTGTDCKGGCLKIEYSVNDGSNNNYNFKIVYEGMSASSVTLKKNDNVTKGEVIGTIGSPEESEYGSISSLHLGYIDSLTNTLIDPTNIVIQCQSLLSQNPNATIIDIPQNYNQIYTVTCYEADGWHMGCRIGDATPIASSSNQKLVHTQWVNSGARYKNGLAIMNLDGVDRYLVATASKLGVVGDSVNFEFADGYVLPVVIADQKSSGDSTYSEFGHLYGNNLSVIELEVDTRTYIDKNETPPSTSGWGVEWDTSQKAVKAAINGSILDGSASNNSTTTTSQVTNGLRSCSSSNSVASGANLDTGENSGNSSIEAYVTWLINIANDESVGYSQSTRNLNPNVDCSSFVYFGLTKTGIIQNQGSPFTTASMGNILKSNGFTELPFDENILKRGDIFVSPGEHTGVYIGDNKSVEAHIDYDGANGDSTGKEVNVSNFTNYNYRYIYRLQ